MSEVQKPLETPVVAPVTTTETTPALMEPLVDPVAKAEDTPAALTPLHTTTQTPAAAIAGEPVKESATHESVNEAAKPLEEGILGYKAPGLIKSFIFSKKHFWFDAEPVESKNLTSYLRGEKPEHANHNAAWASHTGKGLLFFSKKHTEKATPAGIINLSAITSDVITEGPSEFHFLLDGHKHTFQANTAAERDSWVSLLKTKIAEAKGLSTSVTDSETYKKTHGSLSKPIAGVVAAVGPKKSEEKKVEKEEDKIIAEGNKQHEKHDKAIGHGIKKDDKVEAKADKEEVKDHKKSMDTTRKSRSQSRKRQSIFGAIPGFGAKKEDKLEDNRKEEAVIPETTATTSEPTAVSPVIPEYAPAAPAVSTGEPVADRPAPAKRASIFGTLKSQFSHKEKKPEAETAAPVVPAKDNVVAEPVSETAPVIPAVETTEPLATSVASPATVPTETTGDASITNGESKLADTPTIKSDKRKSSLPWLSKKEKPTSSDEEAESKTSPFAKLRATVKGKSSPKSAAIKEAEEKKEANANETAIPVVKDQTSAEPSSTTAPVVSEPVASAPTSAHQVPATA